MFSFGSGELILGLAEVLCRHQSGLTVALSEHILGGFALSMAAVANDWQTHVLVSLVIANQLLEVLGQVLELRLVSQARLEQLGLDLHLVLEVPQRGPLQIFRVLLWRHCRLSCDNVLAPKLMEATSL